MCATAVQTSTDIQALYCAVDTHTVICSLCLPTLRDACPVEAKRFLCHSQQLKCEHAEAVDVTGHLGALIFKGWVVRLQARVNHNVLPSRGNKYSRINMHL